MGCQLTRERANPAPAGMNPDRKINARKELCRPRAGGDEPNNHNSRHQTDLPQETGPSSVRAADPAWTGMNRPRPDPGDHKPHHKPTSGTPRPAPGEVTMPIRVTIPHELQRKAARWIEDCLKLDIPVHPNALGPPQPLISPDAKPGVDQLLRKAKRARDGESVTLSLNWKQSLGLADQVDIWAHQQFMLPEAYRNMMPSGVFGQISMYLEGAMYDRKRTAGKRRAA